MAKGEYVKNVADVFSLDYEGRGVARSDGKTVFIKGAMPSETVGYRVTGSKKQFDEAEVESVLKPSGERVKPKCRYFDTCGSCVLQHIEPNAQVAFKQRILEEQLARIGKVLPEQILPPIYAAPWHYRDRARLSVAIDASGKAKFGFQAKRSHDVVDIASCEVLPQHISVQIPSVTMLLQTLVDSGAGIKFVEFYRSKKLTVLNLCFYQRPSEKTECQLRKWFDASLKEKNETWQLWIQYGKESAQAFYPIHHVDLSYDLPEYDLTMPYRPGDFTQINADLNALMISRAIRLLDIRSGERIADLFCGLGNFSLPMAKCGASVVGIEGADYLVNRAQQNAMANGCADQVEFQVADLFDTDEATVASWGQFDKMLLDPPRKGAYAVVKSLHLPYLPKRIVYVSCNPATLARDAAVLIEKGYVFKSAGVMNMFPQTAHVESIGVFEW
ncbi:23S rRNA (uracil(1939)-C(5))-methyltransferase RlmD [Neisseria yangbaofengii]|uniref:23S rRNA (uracil(1939)-C(5))-methyltransferase RlmD n=1 Tax=Neisseria yangbaofengii TaxID=2709396 RepID=UPI0013ED5A9A|nr:23S rRNA (uracil(1939)-C(5))-methyltransferase RlmD [Neisseria yangbaofengii]